MQKPTKKRSLIKAKASELAVFKKEKAYRAYVSDLKKRIHSAQLKAAHAANSELIELYWEIGKSIIERQKTAKWGSGFLEHLSEDLQSEFPGMQGFSEASLRRMRQFAEFYPDTSIRSQAVTELPWGHIQILLFRVKEKGIRDWYAAQALENGWARSLLEIHIKTDLYGRQGRPKLKVSNFHGRLPPPQSDLAEQSLKDPYVFDFLTVGKDAHEREIEKELTTHITKFLLELGTGFAFVGNQVEYQLTKMMPKELKTSLPTIKELEEELTSDLKEIKGDVEGK